MAGFEALDCLACDIGPKPMLSQVLGYVERSLARLLQRHCGVAAAKQHQRADWRARSATLSEACMPACTVKTLRTALHMIQAAGRGAGALRAHGRALPAVHRGCAAR